MNLQADVLYIYNTFLLTLNLFSLPIFFFQFLWNITTVIYVTLLAKAKFIFYFVSMFGDSSSSFRYIAVFFVTHSRWIHWETFKLIEGRFLSYAIRFIYSLFIANLEAICYLKLICFWLVLGIVPMRLNRCFPQLPQGISWKYLN